MSRKLGELCPLFGGRKLGPHITYVAWDEVYIHTKWHLTPSSRLGTTDVGQKLGDVPLLGEGWKLGPHLTQFRLGRGLPPYQVVS